MPAYRRKIKRGERWRYAGSHLGQFYCSKSIYLTKKEAQEAERSRIKEIDDQARKPTKDVMLLEFLNARLDCLEGKSKTYYRDNKRYLKMFLDQTGDKSVLEVSKLDVNAALQSFSDNLKKRGKTQHKANAFLAALKSAFNYGIELYELDIKNPVTQRKRSVEKKIKFIPTDKMIKAVKGKCDPEQILMIDFILDTGARINEVLRFSDSDLLEKEIVLYTRKSRNSDLIPRKVPKPVCLKGLKFRGRLFKRWTDYPHFLMDIVRELKQPNWAWHSLRHRYASRLSKSGKPLYEIMLLLGHSQISTTQGYLQLLP